MCVDVVLLKICLQVQPTMEQYELDTFGRSHDIMSNFWNSCFDDLMSTALRRDKDRSDSKSKFQVVKLLDFMHKYCLTTACYKCSFSLFALLIGHLCLSVWGQEVIVDPYMKRVRSENGRYLSWQKQSSSQQGVVWQHWKALRRLLTSERGAWANRYDNPRLFIQNLSDK